MFLFLKFGHPPSPMAVTFLAGTLAVGIVKVIQTAELSAPVDTAGVPRPRAAPSPSPPAPTPALLGVCSRRRAKRNLKS